MTTQTDARLLDDREPSTQARQRVSSDQALDWTPKSRPPLVMHPEDDDPRVAAGWIASDVGEARVEGQEHALLGGCGVENRGIGRAAESLAASVMYVVAAHPERLGEIVGEILVELESHSTGSVCSGNCSS